MMPSISEKVKFESISHYVACRSRGRVDGAPIELFYDVSDIDLDRHRNAAGDSD